MCVLVKIQPHCRPVLQVLRLPNAVYCDKAFILQYTAEILKSAKNLAEEHPTVDYTPPSFITLLFTDLGVLTPSAVSDELIKLYL